MSATSRHLILRYVWICGMSGPILCLDLWYVWSDPMSGSTVCAVYPASPSTMDLWYVWPYPMSARTMIVWYVWCCPTSPRPAVLWYARSYPMSGSVVCLVLSYAGLCATAGVGLLRISPNHINVSLKCECVVHTAPYSAPARRRGAPAGGTHTPDFDTIVRSGREPRIPVVCTRGGSCGAQTERRRPSPSKRRRGPFRKWECERCHYSANQGAGPPSLRSAAFRPMGRRYYFRHVLFL
jgi:hypothetical protein